MQSLIDQRDAVIDYRKGDEFLVSEMKRLLQGKELKHAFDATSEKGSFINLGRVLAQNGKLNLGLYILELILPV